MPRLSDILSDPVAFAKRLNIKLKSGKIVPFGTVMSQEQEDLLRDLATYDRIAIVKARQMGFSTASRAYGFHRALTMPNHVSALLSNKERGATELMGIDRRFYHGLPEGLAPRLDVDRATEMGFSHGSRIAAFSGSARNDRGYTLGTLHVTEYSHIEDGQDILATLMASLGPNGKVIVESTPSHYGDPLHKLVQSAAYSDAKEGGWRVVFHPWHSFDSYSRVVPPGTKWTNEEVSVQAKYNLTEGQLYWRRCRLQESHGDETLFKREFPATLDEAYELAEGAYYGSQDLSHLRVVKGAVTTTTYGSMTRETFLPADGNRKGCYAIGVDPAGGTGGDHSVAICWDRSQMKPACILHGNRTNLADFAKEVNLMGRAYFDAPVHYELNNHGQGFKQAIASLGYMNVTEWLTTEKSKVELHETMRNLITTRMVDELDSATIQELRSLERSDRGLAPSASAGNHDDRAIALGLVLKLHTRLPPVQSSGGNVYERIGFDKRRTVHG